MFAGVAPAIIEAAAREAEALGYHSCWVNYPGSIDGLAALTVASRHTQRIRLGVGVIPLQTRGAASIADGVRANGLPLDRLLLGVGSANPGALARVRDGVAALRSALPARLIVAALGPQMCRLAGALSDGVLLNWLTPAHARRSAEWVRAGAAEAGRQTPPVLAYVRAAIGDAARTRLTDEAARYATIPAYQAHFARMRASPTEAAIAVAAADRLPAALADWDGAVDELILRIITGSEAVDEYVTLVRAAKP